MHVRAIYDPWAISFQPQRSRIQASRDIRMKPLWVLHTGHPAILWLQRPSTTLTTRSVGEAFSSPAPGRGLCGTGRQSEPLPMTPLGLGCPEHVVQTPRWSGGRDAWSLCVAGTQQGLSARVRPLILPGRGCICARPGSRQGLPLAPTDTWRHGHPRPQEADGGLERPPAQPVSQLDICVSFISSTHTFVALAPHSGR